MVHMKSLQPHCQLVEHQLIYAAYTCNLSLIATIKKSDLIPKNGQMNKEIDYL